MIHQMKDEQNRGDFVDVMEVPSGKWILNIEKKSDFVSAYFIEFSNLIYTNWGNCAEYSGNFAIF